MHCSRRYVYAPRNALRHPLTRWSAVSVSHYADARGGREVNRLECSQSAGTSPVVVLCLLVLTVVCNHQDMVSGKWCLCIPFLGPRLTSLIEPTPKGTSAPRTGVHHVRASHATTPVWAVHQRPTGRCERCEPHNDDGPLRVERGGLLPARSRRRERGGLRQRERVF